MGYSECIYYYIAFVKIEGQNCVRMENDISMTHNNTWKEKGFLKENSDKMERSRSKEKQEDQQFLDYAKRGEEDSIDVAVAVSSDGASCGQVHVSIS